MEAGSSGISVVEIPPRDQVIPVERESITAFIGPTPRGPVSMPVAVRSLEEFLQRFGVPGYLSRMELLLYQYFENGGTLAIVVRVCRVQRHKRISLPGPAGELVLEALNPGALEHLRATVDFEGIPPAERHRFNLVLHRCRSPQHPLVEEQESYPGVSVRPADADFIGDALGVSALVRLIGPAPTERPGRTIGADSMHPMRYIYSQGGGLSDTDNAPTDYDLIGSRDDSTGLFALEQVPWVDFVCLLPGASGTTLGPVALFAAERYCRERHAMLLIDPPAAWSDLDEAVRAQRERGFASPNALTYFPSLESPPHLSVAPGLSAAGAIAGRLCATGLAWDGPLQLTLGRGRPSIHIDEHEAHQLARLGVNTLVPPTPGRVELAGLVTMARSGGLSRSWNNLRRRRIFLFIANSLSRHTRWAAYEPGDPALWREVRSQCAAFLAALHAKRLLAGSSAREAFYVKCDADTHAGPAGSRPRLAFVVGVALQRPGDFVACRIIHTDEGCRVEEIGWQPGPALAMAG
ncbi:MAG: hypothetical protein L6Q83_11835 [Gammaproteobacteria bacterium]|nr:hypothetical protein [Gammaproteobacteria bacterium]